jgi:hypothetical protein
MFYLNIASKEVDIYTVNTLGYILKRMAVVSLRHPFWVAQTNFPRRDGRRFTPASFFGGSNQFKTCGFAADFFVSSYFAQASLARI